MRDAPASDVMASKGQPALPPLVGGPRDRLQAGALPTDVDRFRELVWQPLAAVDSSGRRWLAALAGFELLRHGAAEPDGILHATGSSVASMLGTAETTWCRSGRQGQSGYGPLLEAAGLLVRLDWRRYRLPVWQALQNRAPDATLQGRFVYTHRPTFRATVVRWRLANLSLAALGAWSVLRYCHTRWDNAELPLSNAAIARHLGVKPHTWGAYADELAGCGALQRLRPTAGSGWRLPLYFVLRTGRGLREALTVTVDSAAGDGADHAEAAVQLHAASAAHHAKPAAGLSVVRAREDPLVDGGEQEQPGGDVERTLQCLAAVAGDAWQQEQVRASTILRACCAELLARTGWSPHRLAAELSARELRTAREPVRVLAYRARSLLSPSGDKDALAPARQTGASQAHEDHNYPVQATSAPGSPETPPAGGELDALDRQKRRMLLEAARARLRRIGLPRTGGDFPDHHPLLRGEALNLLRHAAARATDTVEQSPATARGASALPSVEPENAAAAIPTLRQSRDLAATEARPDRDCGSRPDKEPLDAPPVSLAFPERRPGQATEATQPAPPPLRARPSARRASQAALPTTLTARRALPVSGRSATPARPGRAAETHQGSTSKLAPVRG